MFLGLLHGMFEVQEGGGIDSFLFFVFVNFVKSYAQSLQIYLLGLFNVCHDVGHPLIKATRS
jgi:hypothetical protein